VGRHQDRRDQYEECKSQAGSGFVVMVLVQFSNHFLFCMFVMLVVVSMLVIVLMIVGMSVMVMIMAVIVVPVVVVLVVTRIPVGVIVIADAGRFFESQQIEKRHDDKADPRDESIDPETRVEVPFDSARCIEVDENRAPDQESDQG